MPRAWQAGAGPGAGRLVIDVDSFVGEVYGNAKQGAGYGYTRKLGYHPLLATRADTNEVLHVRLRKEAANTQRGMLRFVDELLARVRRAGASGQILLRADSGFWNKKVVARLREQGCGYSIGVKLHRAVTARIALIPEDAWQPIADYPDTGVCELAETTLGQDRLIVRRVHLHAQADQTELFTYWRHFAFITNRTEAIHHVDSEHRQHAQVELVIRDLKDQALAHFPSGHYSANSAWTVIACLAHNLARWTSLIGLSDPTPRTAATTRRRLFALPAGSPAAPGARHCTSPRAGPGRATSSKRSPASERSPPPDPHREQAPLTLAPPAPLAPAPRSTRGAAAGIGGFRLRLRPAGPRSWAEPCSSSLPGRSCSSATSCLLTRRASARTPICAARPRSSPSRVPAI